MRFLKILWMCLCSIKPFKVQIHYVKSVLSVWDMVGDQHILISFFSFQLLLVWKIQAMSSKAVSYKTLEIYTEGQNYKSMFSHLRTIRGVWYYMEISPHLWPIIWPGFWNILVVYFSNSGICHFLLYSFGIEYMLPTLVIAFLSIHSYFSNFISNS